MVVTLLISAIIIPICLSDDSNFSFLLLPLRKDSLKKRKRERELKRLKALFLLF